MISERILLVLTVCICFSAYPVYAGDAGTILDSILKGSRGGQYLSIRDRLLAIFESAEYQGIPISLLSDRMSLGISRGVPPARLVGILEEDLEVFSDVLRMVDTHYPGAVPAERTAFAKATYAYIMSGVDAGVVTAVMEGAAAEDRDITAAISALDSVARISATGIVSDEDLAGIGTALLSSGIPEDGFGAVSSFYLKAVSRRIGSDEAVEIIIRVLEQGGGIIQMEQELERRAHRR